MSMVEQTPPAAEASELTVQRYLQPVLICDLFPLKFAAPFASLEGVLSGQSDHKTQENTDT